MSFARTNHTISSMYFIPVFLNGETFIHSIIISLRVKFLFVSLLKTQKVNKLIFYENFSLEDFLIP